METAKFRVKTENMQHAIMFQVTAYEREVFYMAEKRAIGEGLTLASAAIVATETMLMIRDLRLQG